MKYIVQLNDERKTVSLDAEQLSYEGEPHVHAELSDIEGSPVRMVKIGTHVYRVVAQKRDGRGRYTLWVDGYRFETEALDERTRAVTGDSRYNSGSCGAYRTGPGAGSNARAHRPRQREGWRRRRGGAGRSRDGSDEDGE